MTLLIIYSVAAVLAIGLVALLLRRAAAGDPLQVEAQGEESQDLLAAASLSVAERIFDPSDYRWLRDEVRFPHLARSLARARRQLALKWLRALRRSFEESIRTPQPPEKSPEEVRGSWRLLWLTLRFHFLLSYALLVVRCFGPYHRLIASLDWAEAFLTLTPAEEEPPARLPHLP